MIHRDRPPRRPESLSDDEARQGRIVLNTPARKIVFFGGLVLLIAFAIAWRIA